MGEPDHLEVVRTSGEAVTLDDGSVWAIDPRSAGVARCWRAGATIEVRMVSTVAMWPYGLANPSEGSLVRARRSV